MSVESALNTFNGIFSQYLTLYAARTEIYSRMVNIAEANSDPAKHSKDAENAASAFVKTFFKTVENQAKILANPVENIENRTGEPLSQGKPVLSETVGKDDINDARDAKLNEAQNQKSSEGQFPAEEILQEKVETEKVDPASDENPEPDEGKKETPSEKDLFDQTEEPTPDPRSFLTPKEKQEPPEAELSEAELRSKARNLCNSYQAKFGKEAAREAVLSFGQGSVLKMAAEHLPAFNVYMINKLNEAEG